MHQQQVRKQLQQEQQQVLQPQERVQELVLPFCRKQPKQQQPSEPRVQAICSLENSLRGRGETISGNRRHQSYIDATERKHSSSFNSAYDYKLLIWQCLKTLGPNSIQKAHRPSTEAGNAGLLLRSHSSRFCRSSSRCCGSSPQMPLLWSTSRRCIAQAGLHNALGKS